MPNLFATETHEGWRGLESFLETHAESPRYIYVICHELPNEVQTMVLARLLAKGLGPSFTIGLPENAPTRIIYSLYESAEAVH